MTAHVGISLLTLVPEVVGGSERYVRSLIQALAARHAFEYEAFVPSIAPDAAQPMRSVVVESYRARTTTGGRLLAMGRASLAPKAVRRELQLDRLAAIHFPLTVMVPPVSTVPTVTTILDVQHLLLPENFSAAERLYRRVLYTRTARLSARVIAISHHVAETLAAHLGIEPGRIRVAHLGVDRERFRPAPGPRQPFLLYPANRWPHKNHERLFQAFELIRAARPELELVLTGSGHDQRDAPAGVRVAGRVDDGELTRLYQTASALVFPSLYEGFGQPPLEAMACGCPVVCSRIAALIEVCGDAATYVDPLQPESIAEGVLDALRHGASLAGAGLERAQMFSWDESARKHENVYRELIDG